MSIENEIAGLTQSTTDLLEAVNTKKATLDTAVSNAQTAVTDATSQVSLAAAEKVGAQTARDTAESFKDQAYTYSQSAASAVAYQDLTAIAQTKSETAGDVFVYDTSKDSDGGAWRQRTQHTSWYNEPLNTATRGSRKEFPAVAVIVAESHKVTIYDGDDPSLPMWASFAFNPTLSSVTALNGQIVATNATTGYWTAYHLNFITGSKKYYFPSYTRNYTTLRGSTYWDDTTTVVVDDNGNDVAMTVLPDAPIDPATGLPIPTIAVATDGGVSVIKDDGTVVDLTSGSGSTFAKCVSLGFTDENKLIFNQDSSGRNIYIYGDIPEQDTVATLDNNIGTGGYKTISYNSTFNYGKSQFLPNTLGANDSITEAVSKTIGTANGLSKIDIAPDVSESLASYITSTYNTGWMNGDIKLATLSDTDDTDLVATELVTNGTFDTDTSGWTETDTNNQMTPSHNAGALRMTSTGNTSNAVWMGQTITGLTVGQLYTVSADVTITGSASGGVILHAPYITSFPSINSSGAYSFTFKATGTSHEIRAYVAAGFTTGSTVDFDNISLRVAEQDRSVNNNGLQVFGTVQKNPVATGADLVAYSGFSNGNYLEQPYNSDLNFGTGDFCVMGWVKVPDTAGSYRSFERNHPSAFDASKRIIINVTAGLARVYAGQVDIASPVSANTWTNITILRKASVFYLYVNGELKATQANTQDLTLSGAVTRLGTGVQYSGSTHDMSLFRISATAPTAEQIEKIYNDEKVLFQEGAQATLYGTSDAVKALAYDDTTELLHVGTSAGRSVFQGLRRVDNTTDAVGTAISASNGLVAEE